MVSVASSEKQTNKTDTTKQDSQQTTKVVQKSDEEPKEKTDEFGSLTTNLANKAISDRSSDSNQCLVEYLADSSKFLNEKALAKNATTLFVETGIKVFENPSCKVFVFYYNATSEDSEQGIRIASFSADKEIFSAYNWGSLKGKPVGIQLKQDDMLGIPLTRSLEPKDFIYR